MPLDGPDQSQRSSPAKFLTRRLEGFGPLTPNDLALVLSTCTRMREHPAGAPLSGHKRPYGHFIVSGWVGRLRALADGRRQVLTTAIPGEFVGRHPNPLIETTTIALTDVVTLDIGPLLEALERETSTHASLAMALVQVQQAEEAQLAEQVLRLGRRTASERMAHWFLEIHQRLESAGLTQDYSFPMPLTQDLIADVLGLSVVHVNRTLQQLRRAGLIELSRGYVTLRQASRLRAITEFGDCGSSFDDQPSQRVVRAQS
jgi:CRP-like cAMP-binding protein